HVSPTLIARRVGDEFLESKLTQMRNEYGLRELSTLETGKHLNSMPPGTFGFVSDVLMDLATRSLGVTGCLYPPNAKPNHLIEVQRYYDGRVGLVGFLSESDTVRVLGLSRHPYEVTLFSRPWEGARDLIIVPERCLMGVSSRVLQLDAGSELMVV